MTQSKAPDPERLRDLYWVECLSLREIADEFDVNSADVYRWMKRYDIPRRSNGVAQLVSERYDGFQPYHDPDWLRREYWYEGRTLDDIAAECGLAKSKVWRWMRRHGIPRRDPGP